MRKSRDAISQLVQLGITVGTSATTYTPDRNVSRGEMALFLQRLMDQMDVVADGRDIYGYVPDDVDDNDGDFDVESPFRDLDNVPHAVNEAVTHLYELGVASGDSSRTYGPSRDMSRAAMAEFMAAILDHSNLRPEGVLAQMSPTEGLDDFDIVAMISVRDALFRPVEDRAVDWFYTADSDGGLQRNGTCDDDLILEGDCAWDDDDPEADRDGNIFEEFRATAGETLTFYAWIGSRDGDEFDEDSDDFSKAEAKSDKGASNILVRHDVPANAAQVEEAWIVDLDRTSSIEFTIQLEDEDGDILEQEGVEMEVEVQSREIAVDAQAESDGEPMLDFSYYQTRASSIEETVLTDRDGEATFELEGPSRDERLDTVIIRSVCCEERIDIAWSDSDPVLVTARPNFDFYQARNRTEIEFNVEYNLYDQYGTALRGHTSRFTGREGDVKATLTFELYEAEIRTEDTFYTVTKQMLSGGDEDSPKVEIRSGRIRSTVKVANTTLEDDRGYLIRLIPAFFNDSNDNDTLDGREVKYASSEVVWIVENADNAEDLQEELSFGSPPAPLSADDLTEVELYAADRKFRTFFTLWSYDGNDRFQTGGDRIGISEFERLWEQIDGVADIGVVLYISGRGFFMINPGS